MNADARYEALLTRDKRFDGVFFVGVSTTGIYCRPICPARTPGRARCTFYDTAAQAEAAGFRACFRCRPELAPGNAEVDAVDRLVDTALARIAEGALNEGSVDDLAAELGVTARHLRRATEDRLGVSPIALAQTRRLALAKQLLQDTGLSLTEIAFAAGYQSVRRFNAAFVETMGSSPSAMRRKHVVVDDVGDTRAGVASRSLARGSRGPASRDATSDVRGGDTSNVGASAGSRANARHARATSTGSSGAKARQVMPPDAERATTLALRLDYRPPYDWEHVLEFLAVRAIPGVEQVEGGAYRRVVAIDVAIGTIEVTRDPKRDALVLAITPSLLPVVMKLVARVRRQFDLDARPDVIGAVLGRDAILGSLVARRPGLRVPGAIDGFEAAIRAMLGQQVSVAAATTLAGRFAKAFGQPLVRGADVISPISRATGANTHASGDLISPISRSGPRGRTSDDSIPLISRSGSPAGAKARAGDSILPISRSQDESLAYRFPTPAEVVAAGIDAIAKVGVPGSRAAAIHGLAVAVESGALRLDGRDLDVFVETAVALKGIGPWTAHYLAMRALHLPDAFPAADLGVIKALGGTHRENEARAEAWRPFRAYAVMHLWSSLGGSHADHEDDRVTTRNTAPPRARQRARGRVHAGAGRAGRERGGGTGAGPRRAAARRVLRR